MCSLRGIFDKGVLRKLLGKACVSREVFIKYLFIVDK